MYRSGFPISLRYGFSSCAIGYSYILGWCVLRQYSFVRTHLERPLFFGFRGSRFCVATLGASLPQRIPEKQRRTTFVVVGSIVPRRLGGRHRLIGISCPCAQGSPVAPAAKITRQSSALVAPR